MLSRENSAGQGKREELLPEVASTHMPSILHQQLLPSREELSELFDRMGDELPPGVFSQVTDPGANGARTLVIQEQFKEELPGGVAQNKSTRFYLEQQVGSEIATLDFQITNPAEGVSQIFGALNVLNREPNDAYLMNAQFRLIPDHADDVNRAVNVRGWELREAFISGGWEAAREELSDTARYDWKEHSILSIYDTDTLPILITGPESTEWNVESVEDDPRVALENLASYLHQLSESVGSMFRVREGTGYQPGAEDVNHESEPAQAGGIYLDKDVTCGMIALKIPMIGSTREIQLNLHFELPTDPLHKGLMYLCKVDVMGPKRGLMREQFSSRRYREEMSLNQNAQPSPHIRQLLEALHEHAGDSLRGSLANSEVFSSLEDFSLRPTSLLARVGRSLGDGWAGKLVNWYARG